MMSFIRCKFHQLLLLGRRRRMRCLGHVVCMGQVRNAYKSLVRKHKRRDQLDDNIRMYLREKGGKMWTGCIWHRTVTSSGHL